MGQASEGGRRGAERRALITAGLLIIGSLVAIGFYAWLWFGDTAMTTSGYIALALGVLGTLALCVGLMTLVYFSHRYGYDEQAGRDTREKRE